MGNTQDKQAIARLIDHTLLKPYAGESEIIRLCEEAKEHGFFSVCVHPSFVRFAKDNLMDSDVRVTTVIGFPHGMTLTRVKVYEAIESSMDGADEIDIVINIGMVRSGRWDALRDEISAIIMATPYNIHKIILETHYLKDDEKIKVCRIAMDEGAEFVKTSTGFAPRGAMVEDVRLIRSATNGRIGIKASGGIRSLRDVLSFIEAGATRIGTSSGVDIIKEIESLPYPQK
ncbi:MAG: deoxyribose-phosphate aldolase [Thermodesulfovibrionia bacterium]